MNCSGIEALKHARSSAGSDSLRPMEHDKVSAELKQCDATLWAWAWPGYPFCLGFARQFCSQTWRLRVAAGIAARAHEALRK